VTRPLVSLVNPDDASFFPPPNMPAALADFYRRHGQPVPAEPDARSARGPACRRRTCRTGKDHFLFRRASNER
jgi:hypothetical protein